MLEYRVREASLQEKQRLNVRVMAIRKTAPGSGVVVIAPTVGLGSLLG